MCWGRVLLPGSRLQSIMSMMPRQRSTMGRASAGRRSRGGCSSFITGADRMSFSCRNLTHLASVQLDHTTFCEKGPGGIHVQGMGKGDRAHSA